MGRNGAKKSVFGWLGLGLAGLIAACIVLVLGGMIALQLFGEEPVRKRLLEHFRKECPACKFELKELEFAVLSGRVIGRDILVASDPDGGTRFEAKAKRLEIDARLRDLLIGRVWIERIHVDELDFLITDNGYKPPDGKVPTYPWLKELPAAHIERTEARQSKFTFATENHGHRGWLTFHAIDANAGPVGTRRELSPDFVEMSADARQGTGAIVRIDTKVGLYEYQKTIDTEIVVRDAVLSNLVTIFLPEMGVRIAGELKKGTVSTHIRDRVLTQRMTMDYRGLKAEFVKGHEGRSGLAAGVQNLIAGAMIDEDKKRDGSEGPPESNIRIEQKRLDGVFKFMLEGLKEGALKIVKSG